MWHIFSTYLHRFSSKVVHLPSLKHLDAAMPASFLGPKYLAINKKVGKR